MTVARRDSASSLPERPCSVRRRRLRPVGKRIRANPESAATKPGRESEMAEVPRKRGRTAWREGPLLSSSAQSNERQPDCPRKGMLNPGPVEPRPSGPRDLNRPANCRGRYAEQPSSNRKGDSHYSTIRSVGGTFCKRPGNG